MQFYQQRFTVAPMLDWTTKYCRAFHRTLSKQATLYSEMITTGAIIHGKYDFLRFSPEYEGNIICQLGGNNPQELAICAKKIENYGYSGINLNVGCPSNRVQNGSFGACLMKEPQLVADCVKAMQDVVNIPVSIKSRIGIDDLDSYEFLETFVKINQQVNIKDFIIHARKAILSGLSPKENRTIPPLNYERVYLIKKQFPDLNISINGGISSMQESLEHLKIVDGVMIGREAYQNPKILLDVDKVLFNKNNDNLLSLILTDNEKHKLMIKSIESLYDFFNKELKQGTSLSYLIKPLLNAFTNCTGARQWRRYLSENSFQSTSNLDVIKKALEFIELE